MAVRTKQQVSQLLSKLDALEIYVEQIGRSDSPSIKKSKESAFFRKAQKSIGEQRDLVLIQVKVK